MADEPKPQEEVLQELGELRKKLAILEAAEAEQKRTEEALQQSHEELQAIYDGMVDGLLIADVETKRFLRVNPAMQCLTGYSQEELLSMSVMELHPLEDLPHVLERFSAQAEGRLHISKDCPIMRKDGSIFHANIAASHIAYHGRPCLIGFFRDITESKQAQEWLRRSEEQSRSLVEACPDAVVMSDLQDRVLFASPQTWKLLGLPEDYDLNGRSVLDYVIEEDRQRLAANMASLVEAGVRRDTEYTALRQDGTTISVEASSAVVRDAAGRPKAVMAVIRDITERKRAHQSLLRERRTLEHMLRASDHERQLIAYEIHDGVAQELAAAMMHLQMYEHLKQRQHASAKATYDAGMQMLQQVHFKARRLISGVRPPILDESGLVAALAHLVHEQQMTGGPAIEYQSDVQFDRLALALENAIYRIAQEALANACRHSRSERVRIALVEENGLVRLEVQDWGVGFDPTKVDEDRFGLEGIRQRARLLGGQATIESQPEKGALIHVVLPLLEPQQPRQA